MALGACSCAACTAQLALKGVPPSPQELEAIGADKSGILGRTLSPGQNKAREFLALIHKQFKVDFAKYDTDGNGVLTQEEFKAAISSLGLELLPHQLRDIFSLIDTDGNGELSLLVRAARDRCCTSRSGCVRGRVQSHP